MQPKEDEKKPRLRRSGVRRAALEAVSGVAATVMATLMLFAPESFAGPLLLGIVALVLAWPLRRQPAGRSFFLAIVLLVAAWLIVRLGGVLAPFIAVFILAYILDPVVGWARGRLRIPRWTSAAILTILLVGLVAIFVTLLVPQLLGQLQDLASSFIGLAAELPDRLDRIGTFEMLESLGVERQALKEQVTSFLSDLLNGAGDRLPNVIQRTLRSIGSAVGAITVIAVLPVVQFYALRDYSKISRVMRDLMPTYQGSREYMKQVDAVVGNYLRGQLLISLISAVNISFWFVLFDMPFALLLGVMAGVLNMIPQIGAILTNILATIVAIAFGDPILGKLIVVQAVLLGQGVLEQMVLTPLIMSTQTGLHPVLIIVALFVFGALFGLVGFLIAVPITALMTAFYQAFKKRLKVDITGPILEDEGKPA